MYFWIFFFVLMWRELVYVVMDTTWQMGLQNFPKQVPFQ